jgi:hypothetical protein
LLVDSPRDLDAYTLLQALLREFSLRAQAVI